MNTLEVFKYQNASEELKDAIENGEAVSMASQSFEPIKI